MKTSNLNLEPVIYQYRFEHSNNSFGTINHPKTPHLMELRNSIKDKKFDSSSFKSILLTKMGIILAFSAAFTILTLVF